MKKVSPIMIFQLLIIITSILLADEPLKIQTLYGEFEVAEPVIIDLLNSPVMERIKHIHQYGATDYIIPQNKDYSRYEHCVGVWALLRKYGASLEEQIAGLLHDASHTVFSHVGDILFEHRAIHSSYQDDIHEWYLIEQGVDRLLSCHGMLLEDILHKSGKHIMLERNLPDICADRLEYNLQAGLLTDLLTFDDIGEILTNLECKDGCWFFTELQSAKKLASVSLFNTEHVWGNPPDFLINKNMACALKRALHIGLITRDDIHFSTDDIVWNILRQSDDGIIISCFDNMYAYNTIAVICDLQSSNYIVTNKFRGLDPWIKTSDGFLRLTELDDEYRKEYERVRERVRCGWPVCFTPTFPL